MSDFENDVKIFAEKAIIKMISSGSWIEPDYRNRFKVPKDFMSKIWALVDIEQVKKNFVMKLENELADRLVNTIASEMATDIKQILSVKERREAVRALARDNIDKICKL